MVAMGRADDLDARAAVSLHRVSRPPLPHSPTPSSHLPMPSVTIFDYNFT
ncbi:MAG: hypothetical protein DSM106950_30365 [Stigonema ocellatum SAG 48.90 = DSM 106950]|nr:hypothetical protein [Stigonema ocellatum SAG 48.90 = DSM 106950]